jgi:hypothetical protein
MVLTFTTVIQIAQRKINKFRPLRITGEKVVDDESSFDRKPLKFGPPQPEKLVIKFNVERRDPKAPHDIIEKKEVQHVYGHKVDWNDKASVKKLSIWRIQLFARTFGYKNAPRLPWLEIERDGLLDILQKHLTKIGGRWSKINWDEVAEAFNGRFHGKTQKKGEWTAQRKYEKHRGKAASKPEQLKSDREGPWRPATCLQNQLGLFTHPGAKELMERAKAEDKKALVVIARSGEDDLTHNEEEEVGDHIEVHRTAMADVLRLHLGETARHVQWK